MMAFARTTDSPTGSGVHASNSLDGRHSLAGNAISSRFRCRSGAGSLFSYGRFRQWPGPGQRWALLISGLISNWFGSFVAIGATVSGNPAATSAVFS